VLGLDLFFVFVKNLDRRIIQKNMQVDASVLSEYWPSMLSTEAFIATSCSIDEQ
jgi:hypothetical protein